MEPLYNEVIGTMKSTLLYQVSPYIRVKKQRNIKSWDQQNYLVIKGFCYIRPLYNEVPLYQTCKLPMIFNTYWISHHASCAMSIHVRTSCIQWNLVIKRSDITKPSYNEVFLLVPVL